uniref:F-box and WD repeat domain containing 10 n=1 Tax=Salarias fasciatus TaxID=181472 RepID=A0A672F5D4_SALFA
MQPASLAQPGCGSRCGMCPSCVFAPKPPGAVQRVWRASEEFRRRFLMALLLRCRSIRLLESIQSALDVASWTLCTYARSRRPCSPADFPRRGSHRAMEGKPSGVREPEIREWFSRSPDWVKSGYLCRIFTLCDFELLRMASNLASVLLTLSFWNLRYVEHLSLCFQAMPFQSAYENIRTRTEHVEERNVYCGAFFTKVLEDPHRVVDYRGGSLMATGSKDCRVCVLRVASDVREVSVLKGHVGSVHAVLLCPDRGLLITASRDASIRCWSLMTDRCERMLYGHSGSVNCLDVYEDRLVSGSGDCFVKVWSLTTGERFEGLKFKHPRPVRCVKISRTAVFSSCDRGLVKMWSLEKGSLSSVRCLFLDERHLLSGDAGGTVMAWSVDSEAKERLVTFRHPKEVKALTLAYLRVVTGCVDGKIRIFNFLTGECLKDITAEAEAGLILSVHFHDNSILVNAQSSVKLYQFAHVFWDYADAVQGGQGHVVARDESVSKKSAAPLRELPSVGPDGSEPLILVLISSPPAVKESVRLSERAASQRIKKRGLHHPLTRDCIALKVNAVQKTQCVDEASVNMESNARLRDSWAPRTAQDSPRPGGRAVRASTCVPGLKPDNASKRSVSSTCVQTAKTIQRPGGTAEPRRREHQLHRSLSNPCLLRFSPIFPSVSSPDTAGEQRGARPGKTEHSELKPSRRNPMVFGGLSKMHR